jgi:hypothetical protein
MYLNFEAKIKKDLKKVDEILINFINSSKEICKNFCSDMAELDNVRKSLVDGSYLENLIVDKEIESKVQMTRDQFWDSVNVVKKAFSNGCITSINSITVAEVALEQFENISFEHYINSITREGDTNYKTRAARVDNYMWELQNRVSKLISTTEIKD